MRHGSLFSGIGGFDLAAEWMGWENIFHCEINPFCQKILKHYWPYATSYNDITKTDFTVHRGEIDIITGGFPCQPYSTAGKRKGKEDERHLWPEMLRAIREIQPGWIIGENVPGLLNWKRGMVLAEIKADLESEGFEVFPPCVLPACSQNAPHQRQRLWIIAYSNGNGKRELCSFSTRQNSSKEWQEAANRFEMFVSNGHATNASSSRRFQNNQQQQTEEFEYAGPSWDRFPTQFPLCNGNDGLSSKLDGITFPKWRAESIKAAGNAIVPQVAYEIFKAIEQTEKQL